ncbi:MAG: DNA-binding protein [Desulfobulbaceae bacterium]|nr:DNA-binding protein [Desulfobulbaceae bacterium]
MHNYITNRASLRAAKISKICTIALLSLFGAGVLAMDASAESSIQTKKAAAATENKARAVDNVALQGKVLETMNASGYTYLHLDSQQGKVWVAIPETKIAVGEAVNTAPGMVMRNFTSQTLKRNFESIVFSPGLDAAPATKAVAQPASPTPPTDTDSFSAALEAESKGGAAPPHPAVDDQLMGQGGNSPGSAGAVVPSVAVKVDKAPGSDGYTVGEIFTQAKVLDGKTVRVRGQVVKNSRMIMGKNWLHLQDGSGDPAKKQHDLVVTTLEDATEGDIVTVQGMVSANRDFGSGYTYPVLIENAKVEKQ